jgi:hypothetical protein
MVSLSSHGIVSDGCLHLVPASICSSGTCTSSNVSVDGGITWVQQPHCQCDAGSNGYSDFISSQMTVTIMDRSTGRLIQQTLQTDCHQNNNAVIVLYTILAIVSAIACTLLIGVLIDSVRRHVRNINLITLASGGALRQWTCWSKTTSAFRSLPMPMRPSIGWIFTNILIIVMCIFRVNGGPIGIHWPTTVGYCSSFFMALHSGSDYLWQWCKLCVALTRMDGPTARRLMNRCKHFVFGGWLFSLLALPFPALIHRWPQHRNILTSCHYAIFGCGIICCAAMFLYFIMVLERSLASTPSPTLTMHRLKVRLGQLKKFLHQNFVPQPAVMFLIAFWPYLRARSTYFTILNILMAGVVLPAILAVGYAVQARRADLVIPTSSDTNHLVPLASPLSSAAVAAAGPPHAGKLPYSASSHRHGTSNAGTDTVIIDGIAMAEALPLPSVGIKRVMVGERNASTAPLSPHQSRPTLYISSNDRDTNDNLPNPDSKGMIDNNQNDGGSSGTVGSGTPSSVVKYLTSTPSHATTCISHPTTSTTPIAATSTTTATLMTRIGFNSR